MGGKHDDIAVSEFLHCILLANFLKTPHVWQYPFAYTSSHVMETSIYLSHYVIASRASQHIPVSQNVLLSSFVDISMAISATSTQPLSHPFQVTCSLDLSLHP